MIIFVFELQNNTYSVEAYFCISIFVTLAHAVNNLKFLNHEINFEKKNGATKYAREKYPDLRNRLLKNCPHSELLYSLFYRIWTESGEIRSISSYSVQMRENTGHYPREKFWTHEIPTRNDFGLTKYPREKLLDPKNTHEGTMARWH